MLHGVGWCNVPSDINQYNKFLLILHVCMLWLIGQLCNKQLFVGGIWEWKLNYQIATPECQCTMVPMLRECCRLPRSACLDPGRHALLSLQSFAWSPASQRYHGPGCGQNRFRFSSGIVVLRSCRFLFNMSPDCKTWYWCTYCFCSDQLVDTAFMAACCEMRNVKIHWWMVFDRISVEILFFVSITLKYCVVF